MKKTLATLIVLIVLVFALAISAAAANYENLAHKLNALGLLQGTDSGYELDKQPTRAEALVMLIRLLGLEEKALAREHELPFTDVPDWAAGYVTYAYENGLTSGTSETTFSPDEPCNAQMYVTFVLRALGYDDKSGDFTYDTAIAYGKEVKVVDDTLTYGTFLRDQMVAVSYLALASKPKDSQFDTLLEKLLDIGAVSEAEATELSSKFALYDEYALVGAELNDETRIAMTAKMNLDMALMGELLMDMDIKVIADKADMQLEAAMNMIMQGEEVAMEYYFADDYLYINSYGEKTKLEYPISEMLALAETTEPSAEMRYLIDDITKETEDSFDVYTLKISDSFLDAVINQALAMVGGDIESMGLSDVSIKDLVIKVYADSDGALKKMAMSMEMPLEMVLEGMEASLLIKMNMEVEITATGDSVVVTLPDDLDEYVSADEMLEAMIAP